MKSYTGQAFKVGQKVQCNGYPGVVSDVGTGQLKGMVEVRLDRGSVCVGADDAGLIVNPFKCAFCGEVYESGNPSHSHN